MEKDPQIETIAAEAQEEGAPAQAAAEPGAAGAGGPGEEAEAHGEPSPGVEELTARLQEAQAKANENWDLALRTKAELDNLRKRHDRDLQNAHKFALEGFVRDLLQVWDSLELGYQAAHDDNVDVGRLREGTELTLKLLNDVMSKFGVDQVSPDGQPFDPELHQAMSVQPRADVPPNTVVNVIQKGYRLNGRLVRPALVMVSREAEADP